MIPFQVAALMGAHSLGGAKAKHSGYSGKFTPHNTQKFDNEYYQLLATNLKAYTNKASF